jgi:hypothetical protein
VSGERLLVATRGAGPYELVLRCTGAGEQRFCEVTLEALECAIRDFAPFLARRPADMPEVVTVDADALEFVRHNASLHVEVVTDRSPEQFLEDKAARQRALESAWGRFATPERLATLLVGREVATQNRPSIAWLRATPPSEWPAIQVRWNGERALLMGGCHRVMVARELGVREVRAQVHAGQHVVFEGRVGV